ncbi:MAG TPA: TetR/AcrR family transcriptional regulator [Opitutus sp.]|nr:TetR/AcrR family transcriptional regulator [Opitutus sp.]
MAESIDHLYAAEAPLAARILTAAHRHLFEHGYAALTMDELAHEIGVSKKTLYVHFSGKDAIVERIIDAIGASLRVRMDGVLTDSSLTFPQRVSGVVDVAGSTLARLSPPLLRELQRYAPAIYRKLEELRQKNIPYVFGKLIRSGIAEGRVRAEVDPAFAVEFWLHAIRGLVQPASLERTQLTPRQTLEKALNLFFSGLLTPAGRKDYEKYLAT